MDLLLKSFHPYHLNVKWLEERFKQFCKKKYELEKVATEKRVKHAPFHRKVIHKLFGRNSSIGKIILYHDDTDFKKYMSTTCHFPPTETRDKKEQIVEASVQLGILKIAMDLVDSVKHDCDTYTSVLLLFELINMAFFCKEEYIKNTHPKRRWIVLYLCDIIHNITFQKCSYEFSTSNDGLQAESLLQEMRCIMMSMFQTPRVFSVVDKMYRDGDPSFTKEPIPLSSTYFSYHSRLRGRTILGLNEKKDKIHTEYTSPISSMNAMPMPDTLAPACTGSTPTKIDDTDL